jgi:hypothetical protein
LRLPNPDRAIVDIAKLRDYCFNPQHPKGRHKARVFCAALGLTASDGEWLRNRLLEIVSGEATEAGTNGFGSFYMIDFECEPRPVKRRFDPPGSCETKRISPG